VGDEFTDQDFQEAIRWYQWAADQGHAGALNNLGAMHAHGWGFPQDAGKAANYYREAAEVGLATAQANLGFCFLHGDGVDQDDAEAVVWLTSAALQGHAGATGQLGTLHRFGRGVPKNIVMAAKLDLAAAIAGDVASIGDLADYHSEIEQEALTGSLLAALCLAKMHESGLGVETSTTMAYAWLLWGKQRGHRDDDDQVRNEEYEMFLVCYSALSRAEREHAYELVEQMRLRSEQL
jgi:TPR repeat protein